MRTVKNITWNYLDMKFNSAPIQDEWAIGPIVLPPSDRNEGCSFVAIKLHVMSF
jgi:hypothetical protein